MWRNDPLSPGSGYLALNAPQAGRTTATHTCACASGPGAQLGEEVSEDTVTQFDVPFLFRTAFSFANRTSDCTFFSKYSSRFSNIA